MGHNIKIRLEAEDLKQLLKGSMIKKNGVEFFLADIGYSIITDIVMEVLDEYSSSQKDEYSSQSE